MAHVNLREEIGASAVAVWDLLGHLDRASSWTVVQKCEIEGSGEGCVRTLLLVGDERLRERFDVLDEAARRLEARVLEAGGLPLRDLKYSLAVRETAPERCAIDWEVDFEPDGVDEQRALEMVTGFYASVAVSIRLRLSA